ncbi:MAG TPA: four helix bundle protein [Ignavibacteriaceae bacterium]|nr:four helix bundle protein [Ignavibacteriaceae bacterium]
MYSLLFKFQKNYLYEHSKRAKEFYFMGQADQIRRSSRSVAMNIREGYAKRKYENVFIRHLIDSLGSSEETRGWLEFAKDLKYIEEKAYNELDNYYDNLNAKLNKLITNWKTF